MILASTPSVGLALGLSAAAAYALPAVVSRQQAVSVGGSLANQGTQAVTGYTVSITGQLMVSRALEPGVHTPDECFPGDRYIAELASRGIDVRIS